MLRAYASIAGELEQVGYSGADIARIDASLKRYVNLREIVRKASGESLDLKAYEADMRHLIDTYITADAPRKISPFDNIGLLELIVKTGIAQAIGERLGEVKGRKDAIAETIENNVRSKILKEQLTDPEFFGKMSEQLQEIIELRKAKALDYEEYLRQIADLVRKVEQGRDDNIAEPLKRSRALRAIYNNLRWPEERERSAEALATERPDYAVDNDPLLALALEVDRTIRGVRPDGWRGVQTRENVIKQALLAVLGSVEEVNRIFPVIVAQAEY